MFVNLWLLCGFFGAILFFKFLNRLPDFDPGITLMKTNTNATIIAALFISLLGPIILTSAIAGELQFYWKFKGDKEKEWEYYKQKFEL